LSQEKIKLFHQAVLAYENGDLKTLKIIYIIIGEQINPIATPADFAVLHEEKRRLTKLISDIKLEIIKINYR
jgi:hypothetical protein